MKHETITGIEYMGKMYLTRRELQDYYKMTNAKTQRLFEACQVPNLTLFNRMFYEREAILNYFDSVVHIDNRRKENRKIKTNNNE